MRLLIIACLLATAFAKKSYEGHQIWRVDVEGNIAHEAISNIAEKFNLDILAESSKFADILVSPQEKTLITESLNEHFLQHSIKTHNIQEFLNVDESLTRESSNFSIGQYNTFENIETYLTEVADSSSLATLASYGQSVEGRELWQLQLSTGEGKQIFWLDCGTHPREWASIATCVYGIDYLVNGYGSDEGATALLDTYDVYIVPVVNPDGYVNTWSEDRFWRKNMVPLPDTDCKGVDLNRNFDFHWMEAGTSSRQCSSTYGGPSAASEIETINIQNELQRLSDRIAVFYSLHAYSQLWMYPFGYDYLVPDEQEQIEECANVGAAALAEPYGTKYEVGPIALTIYPASGSSVDYVYDLGITYSYTLELRDTGEYGFELPESQIIPTGEESWSGLVAAVLCVAEKSAEI